MSWFIKKHKALICIIAATVIALVYVNQQVLIYQMGLRVKENHRVYSKLVDRNKILGYNVLNLKSPVTLETRLLAKKVDLNMPRKWQVVKLDSSPEDVIHKDKVKKRGLFASLFIVGREAEASPNVNEIASVKQD